MPKEVAGIMLSAILSDTLNRKSPTCTDIDRDICRRLAKISGVADIDKLAREQFSAKAKVLLRYDIAEIIRMDLKRFNIKGMTVAYGVCETPDVGVLLDRKEEILTEMAKLKRESGDDFVFFAMIDIVQLKSDLFIVGEPEKQLAEVAFKSTMDAKSRIMPLGDRVSRKKTMMPPINATLNAGWKLKLSMTGSPSDTNLAAIAKSGTLIKGFRAAA
eukprot:CAMPEP_0185280442 /NCGR_PEP_ID=MMETSP1359-20130426/66107_1 /TAXON_ID=552665 /ORGANISM="Bigelowiella longifila, Strain CCMP242" /LENGTH=215 /DNA_ID=CAMNT_0027875689 /DNA_START=138 /DNA_END=785 /DNA_ORIENTATION=-